MTTNTYLRRIARAVEGIQKALEGGEARDEPTYRSKIGPIKLDPKTGRPFKYASMEVFQKADKVVKKRAADRAKSQADTGNG